MCKQIINSILGIPSARKQAAQAEEAKKEAAAIAPRRATEAPEARESDADIKDTEVSSVTSVGTGVSVVRSKKNARKGVPGLGL
jgi:hypothetical protein